MQPLIVVNNLPDWPFDIPGVHVVSARSYLSDPAFGQDRNFKVYNLCRSHHYQSLGYYVSLLAEARGHKPIPRASAMEDVQSQNQIRLLTGGIDDLIQHALAPIKSDRFELSVYFGRNIAHRYDKLSLELFDLLQAPLLKACFERRNGQWCIRRIDLLGSNEVPEIHRQFLLEAAIEFFHGRRGVSNGYLPPRFTVAVLHRRDEPGQASNDLALEKFAQAGESLGLGVEFIGPQDFHRLPEYDALFIRSNTNVHHYTYRFARRAEAEGMVVIDDPQSILRCNNKVYTAELLAQHDVATPRTLIVHRDNLHRIVPELGLPCVLKQPDSAFSLGVTKVQSESELMKKIRAMMEKSELIIAQEFLPTEFDWRIGVLDRRLLYAAKYFMAPGHWQIIQHEGDAEHYVEGNTLALPLDQVPEPVLKLALQAANLFGNGFYGVDIKQIGDRCCVIEVNDNPNVDAGNEDQVIGDALYRAVMQVFLRRIEAHKLAGVAA